MSNKRYIEIDSTYRDRNRYPLASDFIVELAQSGSKDRFEALDPVSNAAPILIFTGNFDLTGGDTVTGAVESFAAGLGAATNQQEIIIEMTAGEMQQNDNWYVGSVLRNTTSGEQRRIVAFKYINTTGGFDRGTFTVLSSFGTSLSAGDAISIANPSDNSSPNAVIFIPETTFFMENFYVNRLLENTTIGETRTITSFDTSLSLAILDTPFGGGWTNTDSYIIRTSLPFGSGTLVASTLTTFELPGTFSDEFNAFTGDFIRITSGGASGDIRRIASYSSITAPSRIGSVSPPFSVAPGAVTFELLQFTRDNYTPLNYTGNIVSQQEVVCYEIDLLSLILPNEILAVGLGNRITFYPYVYVELSNVSAAGGHLVNILWSNNPNSTRAIFKVPIKDVPNPVISSFIKLDGVGAVQHIKFKPNDALHFRVFLPNGESFQTTVSESNSPLGSNPLIQISALFGIKRTTI